MRIFPNIIMFFVCIFFTVIITFLDWIEGFSLFENIKYVAYCIISFIIIFYIYSKFKNKKLIFFPIIYVLVILIFPFTNFFPTKPLLRSYHKFSIGMNMNQITNIVKSEFAKTKYKTPKIKQIDPDTQQYILDQDNPDYDSFWLIVYYKNNLYQRARFSPD